MTLPFKLPCRIEPRDSLGPLTGILVIGTSLILGFVAIGIVFAFNRTDPFFALYKIFAGSFGSAYGLSETITKAIPLLIIGAGLCLPYQGRFWNIGAESQLLIGALAGTWAGIGFLSGLPGPLIIPAMFLVGFIGGALWGIIPALLKIRMGVNEVISTLMLNYVAMEVIQFLIVGPLKGKTQHGFPYSDDLPRQAWLPMLGTSRIHWPTLVLGLVACVILFLVLKRSKFGYEVRVIGENHEAARYAGIGFLKTSVIMMAISGGLAGLAGMGEVAGLHHHLSYPQNISAGYGFTAIIVAWLARLNPLGVILSSFFFAGILVGGDAIQISLKLPAATVNVFNGILLVFLIAGDFFLSHRLVRVRPGTTPQAVPAGEID